MVNVNDVIDNRFLYSDLMELQEMSKLRMDSFIEFTYPDMTTETFQLKTYSEDLSCLDIELYSTTNENKVWGLSCESIIDVIQVLIQDYVYEKFIHVRVWR